MYIMRDLNLVARVQNYVKWPKKDQMLPLWIVLY